MSFFGIGRISRDDPGKFSGDMRSTFYKRIRPAHKDHPLKKMLRKWAGKSGHPAQFLAGGIEVSFLESAGANEVMDGNNITFRMMNNSWKDVHVRKQHHTQTQQNWAALKQLAFDDLRNLKEDHPEWTREILFAFLQLPRTALMLELAASAGFKCAAPTAEEACAVLNQQTNGVRSEESIARNTGIDLEKVQKIIETRSIGYGQSAYGNTPFGGNRAVSDGKSAVARRTTVNGQLSYRGHRYSLGAMYRGRMVFVIERERELLITCNDRSPLHITRYRSG